jgi:hypothetical protein
MNENYIKLRFLLDPAEWHGSTAERLWTEVLWGGTTKVFRLMNSPFYARGVSYLDIVRAIPAPDGYGIDYAGIVEKSGHSTIWLLVPSGPPPGFNNYWLSLERLHCSYESSSMDTKDGKQTLYSVDVPPETNIDGVLSIIEEAQDKNVWLFQIGDLAHKRGGDANPQ